MTKPYATGFPRSELIRLVVSLIDELQKFRGFELPVIAVLLRVSDDGDNAGEFDLGELSRLAGVCRGNLDRLLRVMSAEGAIDYRSVTSNTIEIRLSATGRQLLGRILAQNP